MAAQHFHRELEKVKKAILSLGAMVEDRVHLIDKAIQTRDVNMANKIIRSDHEIDEMEVEIEEECLKVIALYQPVAVDLRFLVSVVKINTELERIGDQAVNIAQRIKVMAKEARPDFAFDYSLMIEKVEFMLKRSLDSLINMDVDLAIKVCQMDDEVDKLRNKAYDWIKKAMKENTERMSYLLNLFLISRHLERLADHSTNIAEEVIYLIEGEIVRHGKKAL